MKTTKPRAYREHDQPPLINFCFIFTQQKNKHTRAYENKSSPGTMNVGHFTAIPQESVLDISVISY